MLCEQVVNVCMYVCNLQIQMVIQYISSRPLGGTLSFFALQFFIFSSLPFMFVSKAFQALDCLYQNDKVFGKLRGHLQDFAWAIPLFTFSCTQTASL